MPKLSVFRRRFRVLSGTAVQTVVTTYQVYDVPAPTVTYIPCDNGVRRCRTVCREVRVEQ